jgi:hypothetical protein
MREDKEGANGVLAKMLYELQKCAAQRDRDVAERERAVSERERKINVAVTTSEQELQDAESRMATRMREVEELLRSQLAAEQAAKLKLQEEVDEARGQATKAQREKAAAELKAGKLEQELKATRAPFVHRKRSQVLEQPSADEHSPNLEPLPSSVMNSPQLVTQCPLALSPSHSLTLSLSHVSSLFGQCGISGEVSEPRKRKLTGLSTQPSQWEWHHETLTDATFMGKALDDLSRGKAIDDLSRSRLSTKTKRLSSGFYDELPDLTRTLALKRLNSLNSRIRTKASSLTDDKGNLVFAKKSLVPFFEEIDDEFATQVRVRVSLMRPPPLASRLPAPVLTPLLHAL